MARRICRRLLVGSSLIALAALVAPAAAQNLVNPSGTTVPAGFIKVNPGQTFDNVFNFGTVNGGNGPGIWVQGDGVVLGDVANGAEGVIQLNGPTATGILINSLSASIGDDVENFGLIRIETSQVGYGILATGTNTFIGGDIANRGDGVMRVSVANTSSNSGFGVVTAAADNASAYGIYVGADVTGVDNVVNFGVMRVEAIASANAVATHNTFAGAQASLTGSAHAWGIFIDASSIEGDVVNAGLLAVDAVAHAFASAVATGGEASASVAATFVTAKANANGIIVDVTTLSGGLANFGTVAVAATAEIIQRAEANATTGNAAAYIDNNASIYRTVQASATGIYLRSGATSVGGIANLGSVDAEANGLIDLEIVADASTGSAFAALDGGTGITLAARASAFAFYISGIGTIEEGVVNTGDLSAAAAAVVKVDVDASGFDFASAYIRDIQSIIELDAYASASGLDFVNIGLVEGDVTNRGDIDATATAALDVALGARAVDGDARAFLDATDSHLSVSVYASAVGLYLDFATIAGDLTNDGDVVALADAAVAMAASAYGGNGAATAYMFADSSINMNASASVTGITVIVSDLQGDLVNRGNVIAIADASIEIDIAAHAADGAATAYLSTTDTSLELTATATAQGIRFDIVDIDGDIGNSGLVGVGALAAIDIAITAEATAGNAVAHLNATATVLNLSASANATGISMSITTAGGDITNSGDALVVANAAIVVGISADAHTSGASAYVSGSDISFNASATAYGLYVTISDLAGSFSNSGDLTVTAAASMDVAIEAHAPNGVATAYFAATQSHLSLSADASAYGLFLESDTVGGDVANHGDLDVAAVATVGVSVAAKAGDADALAYMSAQSTGGNVAISAYAVAYGLMVSVTDTLSGDLSNSGDIEVLAHAGIVLGISADANGDATAKLWSYTTLSIVASAKATGFVATINDIDGSIDNSGDIAAVALADVTIDLAAHATDALATADLSTTDTELTISANANAVGLVVDIASIGGNFTNSGAVGADAIAALGVAVSAENTSGAAKAHLQATTNELSILASANVTGLSVSVTALSGDLTNSGDLDATAVASIAIEVAAHAGFTGDATAYLLGGRLSITASADAVGARLTITTVDGAVTNSGDIGATAAAFLDIGVTADAGDNAFATILANTSRVTIRATATATGLEVNVGSIGDDFGNSGAVEAIAVAHVDVAVSAYAAESANAEIRAVDDPLSIGASANAVGVSVNVTSVTDVRNSGDLEAHAEALLNVAVLAHGTSGNVNAFISSTDSISITAEANATGFYVPVTNLLGDVSNSGDVTVSANAVVDLQIRADTDNGSADAFLSTTLEDLDIKAFATAYGVYYDLSTPDGDVSNSGDLDVVAHAGVVIGITAIAETGAASAYLFAETGASIYARASAFGFYAEANAANGGMTNSGDMAIAAAADVAITVRADSDDGQAYAALTNASHAEYWADASAYGVIFEAASSILGDVANSGDLSALAHAAVVLDLSADSLVGNAIVALTADAELSIYADASAYGFYASAGSVDGDVANSGDILAAAFAEVGVTLSAAAADGSARAWIESENEDVTISASATAYGIALDDSLTSVAGDVSNSGAVDAVANAAVVIGLLADAGGELGNDATAYISAPTGIDISAEATAVGIAIDVDQVGGDIVNSGALGGLALATIDVALTARAGTGNAVAFISVSDDSLDIDVGATAIGLLVSATTITGGVDNSGHIEVVANAVLTARISATAPSGQAQAYIRATSDTLDIDATASATGIEFSADTVNGDIVNSGDIEAIALASLEMSLFADGGESSGLAFIDATDTNLSISASATAQGIDATLGVLLAGDFRNSGDIAAIAHAGLVMALTAYASGAGAVAYLTAEDSIQISADANATGITLAFQPVNGDLQNSGQISALAVATLDVTLKADGAEGGEASAFIVAGNSVSISASATATGIEVTGVLLGGDFRNTGDINVAAYADALISLSAHATNGNAFARISADQAVELTTTVEARGIDIGFTSISGDFANDGDADVFAIGNIGVVLLAAASGGSANAYLHAVTGDIRISANVSAYGIDADINAIDNFSNSGDLTVDAVGSVAVFLSAYATGAANDANAYIDGTSNAVDITAEVSAYGIFAELTDLPGGVGNSGALDVAGFASVDVTMYASASSGDAHAYIFGTTRAAISAEVSAYGLLVEANAIGGNVTNSGDLTVDGVANVNIHLEADPPGSAEAYIETDGTLDVRASASAYGLVVDVSTVSGTIDNSGDLDVSAVARVDIELDAEAGLGAANAHLFASRSLSVTAKASAVGIDIIGTAIGDVTNSGALDVDAAAALEMDISADTFAAASGASAFINSTGSDVEVRASASAFGILFANTAMGNARNSGAIDVDALATLDLSITAEASTGDALAYIFANGSIDLVADATAHGMLVQSTNLGGIANSGEIDAAAVADVHIRLSATAFGSENAHIAASASLSIYALASAYGIEGDFDAMAGGFANSGDITSVAVATLDLSLEARSNATLSGSAIAVSAYAHAFGVSLTGNTINGDVTNDADIVASAFASAHLTGLDTGISYTAYALAVAFHLGNSGVLNGDYRNSAFMGAVARATAYGSGTPKAFATAIGLDIDMDVAGNVINSGTIVASAYADSAYAYGIRVIGHAIDGSIQNTGIIAAFADGDSFEEAFAIQLREADGPTVIEQLDGFIIGDINLDNDVDQADTIEFSGGEILGDIYGDGPAGGDELVAFAGVDDVLNISGDIHDVQSINVNPLGASASSVADVELRLGGDVFNSGDLNVNTHGTLVVGLNSFFDIVNYRQVPTGTTLFEVAPGGVSGVMIPTNAFLAGTVGIRPQAGLYADNETYVVIDAGNPVNGTYDNVRSSALLHVEDDYSTPTEVHLNVTRIAFDAVGGLTHNQNAVGGALEADYGDIDPNSDFGAVVGSLFGLSQGEYQDALDDLAGAEHAQMLKIGAGAIQSIDNALMGRLAFVRGLSADQMASVDGVGMAFAQVASTGDVDLHMDLAQAEAQAVANPGSSGIWARVFGGTSTLDGDDEAPGFDTDNGGVSVGIDHRLSPDAIVGLYGGYAHADATFDTNADGSVDTYQIGVYGSWASGGLHVDGMVSGAWQNYELTRSIDFLGRRASSDYDGWAIGASAQVGYDIALGSAAVIEPMAGLDYIHLETDGFSEDGADSVDLNVESGEFDSLRSSLGVRITAQIDAGDGITIIPTASVAWEHEFLDAKGEFTASFDGSPNGTTFDIIGSDDEADAAAISLGVALTSDNMTAFVGYDGKISGDGSAHQGTIGIRFGF